MDYQYSEGRKFLIITDGERVINVPWTDDPNEDPDVNGNRDFRLLYEKQRSGEIVIQEPDLPAVA